MRDPGSPMGYGEWEWKGRVVPPGLHGPETKCDRHHGATQQAAISTPKRSKAEPSPWTDVAAF
eukprot:scaffold32117_cov35-Tisochrysis_lutea.AAC.2